MGKVIEFKDPHIKEIVTDYDKLSERCDEVETIKGNKDVQDLVLDLKHTMSTFDDMCGISAAHVGSDKRVICLDFNGKMRSFVNPVITSAEGLELSREKCHCIPSKEYIRPRNTTIEVAYQTPMGKIESVKLMGMAAKVMQHEIDHLDGLLLSDVGLEIDEEFDNATDEERESVIGMYMDSIDMTADMLDKDINNDPEAAKLASGVKFLAAVQSGKVTLEEIPWTDEEKEIYDEYIRNKNKE